MPFGPGPVSSVRDGIHKQIEKEGVLFSVEPIFLEVPSINHGIIEYKENYKKHRFYELYVEHLKQIGQGIKPQKTQSSDLFVLDGAVLTRYLDNVEKTLSKLLSGKCKDDFSNEKASVELNTFLVMFYLSVFFGVSKYLTNLQSKKEFTKKQKAVINTLCDDANCMKKWSRDVLKALSEANKNNYREVYLDKVKSPVARIFSYENVLHKYAYDGNKELHAVLNGNGLTGRNLAGARYWVGAKEGDFMYKWATSLQNSGRFDTLSIIEDNYYDAHIIIPLVKDMYSLGGDYVCWPLINTYYKLVGEITGNRLKREKDKLDRQKATLNQTCAEALAWARKITKQMPEESK